MVSGSNHDGSLRTFVAKIQQSIGEHALRRRPRRWVVEHVAGNDYGIHIVVPGYIRDLAQSIFLLGQAVVAIEIKSDVPIGGMEDFHKGKDTDKNLCRKSDMPCMTFF